MFYFFCRENTIDRFNRFVKSMDDSVRHLFSVGESNMKKHQGREYSVYIYYVGDMLVCTLGILHKKMGGGQA